MALDYENAISIAKQLREQAIQCDDISVKSSLLRAAAEIMEEQSEIRGLLREICERSEIKLSQDQLKVIIFDFVNSK
jgi:hypothetical protein